MIGVDVKDDITADLGPIAVCEQGRGVKDASSICSCHNYHHTHHFLVIMILHLQHHHVLVITIRPHHVLTIFLPFHQLFLKVGSALLAWAESIHPVRENIFRTPTFTLVAIKAKQSNQIPEPICFSNQ